MTTQMRSASMIWATLRASDGDRTFRTQVSRLVDSVVVMPLQWPGTVTNERNPNG
jgi:hypothetical protein